MNLQQLSYWHLQPADSPLYPDLIWSQPQNPSQAGKLLIIGGNVHGFSAPAEAYVQSMKAGAGSIKVVLPDSLRSIVGTSLSDADYSPSTPSGSFAKRSLAEMLDYAEWSDAVLVAGDVGRNSETAMLLESFTSDYKGKLIITKDALDYFTPSPAQLINRPDSLLVLTMAQLQKISIKLYTDNVVTFGMSLIKLIEALHAISLNSEASFVVKHEDNLIVASNGIVSSTKINSDKDRWRIATASYASVWWLQNPNKVFEALTSAVSMHLTDDK